MNDSTRTIAYGRIRNGAALIGVAVVVGYSPVALLGLLRAAFVVGFVVSIPIAFLIGGQGVAMIVDGIAAIFKDR